MLSLGGRLKPQASKASEGDFSECFWPTAWKICTHTDTQMHTCPCTFMHTHVCICRYTYFVHTMHVWQSLYCQPTL